MSTKIHGVRTGTIDSFTYHGERVKWVPKSELTLIESQAEPAVDFAMPRRIAANPSARQAFGEMRSKDKPPVSEAARIMVGFNVGDEEAWRPGEVYLATYLLREQQLTGKRTAPAFSYYVGLGAFPGEQVVASERSAQLVFMNFSQKTDTFFEQMLGLAESLCDLLHQESVLTDLQEDGRTTYLAYINGAKKNWWAVEDAKQYLADNKHRVKPSVWRTK